MFKDAIAADDLPATSTTAVQKLVDSLGNVFIKGSRFVEGRDMASLLTFRVYY